MYMGQQRHDRVLVCQGLKTLCSICFLRAMTAPKAHENGVIK
jgi:hypothetical protein